MQTYQLLLTECLTQIPSEKSPDRVLNERKLIREGKSEASIKFSHYETLGMFFFLVELLNYIFKGMHIGGTCL